MILQDQHTKYFTSTYFTEDLAALARFLLEFKNYS